MAEVTAPAESREGEPGDEPEQPPQPAWWWAPALVVAVSLAVRVVLKLDGNGFRDTHLYPSMWHLVEIEHLVANPFTPLWDVHTSPPLFNVAVGVLLRWSPLSEARTFQLVFGAAGLFGAVALCQILRTVGCRWWVASVTAIVAFSKPSLLGYETYVAHESFVIPMLTGTVWAVSAYARRPSLGRYGVVLAAAAVLVLTRALFSPLWLAALVLALLFVRPPPVDRRRLVLVTALPFVVVVGVMAKNQVRFGTFSLSSWTGMNLSRAAVWPLGPERIEKMIADGELSPMARVQWFSQYEEYERYAGPCATDFGTPVLDEPVKSDWPEAFPNANYNAACYVPVYEQAMKDSLSAIRHEPGVYWQSVRASSVLYLSDWDYTYKMGGLEGPTAERLYRIHGLLNLEVFTRARYPNFFPIPVDVQLTLVAGLVVVISSGARALRRRLQGAPTPRDLVMVVAAMTVVYVTVVSVTVDAFENSRFREPLDPLLFGAVLGGGLETLARLRRRRATSTA